MQVELEDASRKITNFNTDDGVYHHRRLVYGNNFEIFQRALGQDVGRIKGVKFFTDDIILHAQSELKLLKIFRGFFDKIKLFGLYLNKYKCIIMTDVLKFFGIEISSEGISPDKNKIKVIKHSLPPINISILRSFIALCTYVSRFTDNNSERNSCSS